MSIDVVGAITGAYEIFGPTLRRQCSYIVSCNSNASDLRREIKNLRDTSTRLRHKVDHADSVGDVVEDDVWTWLTEAENLIKEKNLILEKDVVSCCFGFVPNPKARYVLGRGAQKSLPELKALLERGKFDEVSYHPEAELATEVKVRSSLTVRYVDLKSRALVLKRIMADLNEHDKVGVYGMGGVGKTTLLRDVEKRARESGKFDVVVTVYVSQAPNIEGIKSKIRNKLGSLGSNGDEANKKTLLVLLDDLWSKLKEVESLEKDTKVKVKWVMTSRKKELLANGMNCHPTIPLGVLEEEEVWSFFGELVKNNTVEELKNNAAVAALLKKCAGLPVSIEALAKVLEKKGLSSSDLVMEDVLKLEKESIDGSASLELSYNYLGDTEVTNLARSLFQIIGLLGTPTVPILTLLKYTIGLGLLGGGSSSSDGNIMERARRQVTSSLRMLQDASLLLESDDIDYVKIHDVVRDVAASIASRDDGALIFDSEDGLKGWSRDDIPVLNEETRAPQGLGLLGTNSSNNNIMERARRNVITSSLRMLHDASLLLGSDDSNFVKIHDVVRDVAASIASRDDHALIFDREEDLIAGWSKEKLNKCRSVYLPYSVISKLNDKEWECPELRIFIMEGDQDLSRQKEGRDQVELPSSFYKGDQHVELPDALFKHTVKLRVIHFKNARFTSLPSSINSELQNLTTLCLDNCCSENIATIGKLVTLQALSITGSDLAKLPEEIGELTKLRMLDLSKCSKLEFIEPGILKRLTQLEELYLRESFDKWEIDGDGAKPNTSLEELNCMPRLQTLEVHIPDTSKLPQKLPLGDLVQSKVLMGESWDWSGEYTHSRTLKVEVKLDSMITEEWFQSALQKTQDLHLEGLNGTIESFHELCSDGFEELKHLNLQNSSSVVRIIWSLEWLECSAFTALESMILKNLGRLESICDGRISLSTFSKLKVVRVQECHKLRSIFNLSLLKNLTELEEIEISDCDMVRQIVIAEQVDAAADDDATGEEQQSVGMKGCSNIFFGGCPTKSQTTDAKDGATAVDNEIVMLLGNLRYLTLRNLPETTSFFAAEQVDDDDGGGAAAAVAVASSGAGAGGDGDGATGEEQQSVDMNSACADGGGAGDDGGGTTGEEQQSVGMNGCSNILFGRGEGVIRPWKRKITSFFTAEGGPSDQTMKTSVTPIFLNDQKVQVQVPLAQAQGAASSKAILSIQLQVPKPPKYKVIQSTTRLRLDKLQRVELIDCKNVVHFTNSQVLLKLVNLESLTIERCESLEDIFDLEGIKPESGNVEILPKLYELKLRRLPKLEHIWKNNLRQIKGCRKLRTMEIYECNNLLYFSSSFMCEVMENLTEINVGRCEKMGTIFREEERQESKASSVKAQLTSLKILAISQCPNLKTFLSCNCRTVSVEQSPSGLNIDSCIDSRCNKGVAYWCYGKKAVDTSNLVDTSNSFFNEKVFLPNLESLILSGAGEFEKLWCGEIPPGHESYCKLEYLHVEHCDGLRSVIPASMIERLHNLKLLWVMECRRLEVVFDIDVGWKTGLKSKALMLPQLQDVKLKRLASLIHVMGRGSDDEIVVGFPSLNRLEVFSCHKLINVIPAITARTLLELKILDISFCSGLLEVIIGGEVSERYKRNAITFPHLTSLTLYHLHNLTCFSSESHRFDLTRLKILKIEFCHSLKKLIKPRSDDRLGSQDEEDQANTATQALFSEKIQLPNLEELYFLDCEKLEELWNEEPTTSSFCKLKLLEITSCLSLQNVIPSFMVNRLQNLERLCITDCFSLQDIFKTTSSTLEIPTLKKLVLKLTNRAVVEAIMEKVCLPNLEELEVSFLQITEVWQSEPYVGSFSKLKRLQVENCGQLVKIIPLFMLKRLQNLEKLVVKDCNNLEIVCELEWPVDDVQEHSGSSFFQNLGSIDVEKCGRLISLFSISGQSDSDHKIVQLLPQLAYLRLIELPEFNHLFQVLQGQYTVKLSSLEEFFLVDAGDKEAVIQQVAFPEKFEIQLSEQGSNFFGTTTSAVTDIVKALQQTNQVIIGLLGEMGYDMARELEKQALAANPLFDEVVELDSIRVTAHDIQEELGGKLDIVYGEGDVQGRAQRLCKALLTHIRNKRFLLILKDCIIWNDDTIELAGIPLHGFDPKHFKVILFSKDKEILLKMGAQQPIIPIGNWIECRWKIFREELNNDSQVCLPNLEELEVSFLQITEVWQSEPYVGSFSKLKRLQVENCGQLVKIIPLFMLKRLQNLEKLVVKDCNNLEIVCELEWPVDDVQEHSGSSFFQNLGSIDVEKCGRLISLFSISGQSDSDHKIVQLLPQLAYLRLIELPEFNHLFQVLQGQYTVKLSSLEEFFLVDAGDKEAVIQQVAFPEKFEIQLSEQGSNFFGTTTSAVTDIVKALQQTNQVIIGLLGEMGYDMARELEKQALAANPLFDEVVELDSIRVTAHDIQEELGGKLDIVYGEGDVQGRAQRLCKALLTHIRNKRFLLILKDCIIWNDDTIELAGIPLHGFDPKHFKVILFSKDKEILLKMGAQQPIIPIGNWIECRWKIFREELNNDSQETSTSLEEEEGFPAFFDTTNTTDHDNICCFLGPDSLLLNKIMKALYSHQRDNLIIGMLGSLSNGSDEDSLIGTAVSLLQENLFDEIVESDENEVATIQENLKKALGITSSSETDAQRIRQSLLSNQRKRLLLGLANLNQEVDLKAVGIPPIDELDPRFFKILLISDKKEVLQKMGTQQVFEFETSEYSSNCSDFHRILDGYVKESDLVKLADECGSDDLAQRLATKLKGQGMHAWANAFRRLKESPFKYEERWKVIASL